MRIFNRGKKNIDIIKQIKSKFRLQRFTSLFVGVFLASMAFNLFFLPNKIVAGGVSGLSIIADYTFGINPALFILIASIFLLTCSLFILGKEKTIGSVIGSFLFPLFVTLTLPLANMIDLSEASGQPILIAVFSGVLAGSGAGLIFKSGFTTGGTDIINQIVSKLAKVSLGKAMLMTDGLIVLLGGFFFGWVQVMYAIIVLYIISIMTDKVVLGISQSKAFYIVTSNEKEVTDYIVNKLKHTVTLLNTKGGYSGNSQMMLMTVIPTKEYFIFKEGILTIDEHAFFVVTDSYEVQGGE